MADNRQDERGKPANESFQPAMIRPGGSHEKQISYQPAKGGTTPSSQGKAPPKAPKR